MLLPINSVGAVQKSSGALALPLTGPALPPGLVFSRAGGGATCRNASGRLAPAAENAPRFAYDAAGAPLGLLLEGAALNKCTNANCNPAGFTNMNKSGDAAGLLDIVDDSEALAAAKLDAICASGRVYILDNTAGTATVSVDIAGATGNTNPHSFSVWARTPSSGTGGVLTRSGSGATNCNIVGPDYQRYRNENETPSGTSVTLRMRANPGKAIYFILCQLEETPYATSEIVTSGAAAARGQDLLSLPLAGNAGFQQACGFMTIGFRPAILPGAAQTLLCADDGGDDGDTLGLRLSAGATLEAYIRAGGSAQFSGGNEDAQSIGEFCMAGISWRPGAATILSGGLAASGAYAASPSGLSTLHVGAGPGGAAPFSGHISSLAVGPNFMTQEELAALLGA
jgi:hypothetical protein